MTKSFQSDNSAIAISLFRDLATGQWFVARMDLSFGNILHQMRFRSASPLEQAFCPAFMDRLRQYLPKRPDPAVLADSSVTFELNKVQLSGIRVIATRVMDGYQTIVVRFARAMGALTTILAPQYRPDSRTAVLEQADSAGDGRMGDAMPEPLVLVDGAARSDADSLRETGAGPARYPRSGDGTGPDDRPGFAEGARMAHVTGADNGTQLDRDTWADRPPPSRGAGRAGRRTQAERAAPAGHGPLVKSDALSDCAALTGQAETEPVMRAVPDLPEQVPRTL